MSALRLWLRRRVTVRYVGNLLEVPVNNANKNILYRLSCSIGLSSMWKRPYVTTWTADKGRVLNACICSSGLEQRRLKSQKKSRDVESDTESEDEDEDTAEDDFEIGKDFKDITVNSSSLRVDAVIKAGLSIARNKAEDAVYDSRVRLNGRKVLKKGTRVEIGDEVDMIIGISPKNEDFLDVRRIIVNDIKKKSHGGKHALMLRRFKVLTIENYSDPWKGPVAE